MRIAGIACAVPGNTVVSDAFVPRFGKETVDKVVANIGVQERRQVITESCASDLVVAAAEKLLAETKTDRGEIEAIIFATQTPDHLIPATSNTLQHRLRLPGNVLTYDITCGCTGYTDGLILAQSLLKGLDLHKILLLVGDTSSRFLSPNDRETAMLFGDAGSATLLESSGDSFFHATIRDGAEAMVLHQNVGYRYGLNAKSGPFVFEDPSLHMDGLKVFNFTVKHVPKIIRGILETANWPAETVEKILFHQANHFMIRQIAKLAKLPLEKIPISLESFGNTTGASIPLTIATEMPDYQGRGSRFLFVGFGVGMACSAVALDWNDGIICPLAETDC